MSNPLSGADASNSAGLFPQIWAVGGQSFDVTLKNSSGVTIYQQENVAVLGDDDATTISRDFGTGGRVKISGSAGEVSFEAGPPTGDDIGGAARVGGYEGSQADTLELDAAATSTTGTFNTAGLLTQDSDPVNVTLLSGSHSGADLIIALPSGYRSYELDLIEVVNSTTAALRGYTSVDNGANYMSSNYVSDANNSGATSPSLIYMHNGNLDNTKIQGGSYVINTPLSGTGMSQLWGRFAIGAVYSDVAAQINGGARVTNLKISSSAGTWTGRYRLRSRADH